MAGSADLGFTAGSQDGGSYVTVLKRMASCQWSAVLDESVAHAAAPRPDAQLLVREVQWSGVGSPSGRLIAADAAGRAMTEFGEVLQQEGLAAALRTYGRNNDFRLFIDGHAPFDGMDAANAYLRAHVIQGKLEERSRDRSADGTMTYSSSALLGTAKQRTRECLQIWQFDAKVVNWGVRVLLLNRPTP